MGMLEAIMLILGAGMIGLAAGFEFGRFRCELDTEMAAKEFPRCECCHETHAFNRVSTGAEIRLGRQVLAPAHEVRLCDDCARRVVDYVSEGG